MIVPMKKIFIVVQEKDIDPALSVLQEAGTVHVEYFKKPSSVRLEHLTKQFLSLEKVIKFFEQQPCAHKKDSAQEPLADWRKTMEEVLSDIVLVEDIKEEMSERQFTINHIEEWGDFDPAEIVFLREKGIDIQLVEIPEKVFKEGIEGVVLEPIKIKNKMARCVAISEKRIEVPYHTEHLPSASLSQLREHQKQDQAKIDEVCARIHQAAKYTEAFQKALLTLKDSLHFEEVYSGRETHETLAVIQGFCPFDQTDKLKESADEQQWALLVEDPSEDDQVPTLLKNPRWVTLIKPLFNLVSILPGYREADISFVFLIFFSIFFGILVGDAAYGLIFALGTFIVEKKIGNKIKDKTPFYLMYLLCLTTIVWGVLTGTFLGQNLLPATVVRPVLPWLTDFKNVQKLCFFIGAFHLSIAHVWRAIRKMPSLSVLSEVGWLSLLWGMFFMALKLVLGEPFFKPAKILFIIAPICILFFTNPQRNLLKAIGLGLSDLLLNTVNTFTDIVSYIRLFAVGLASIAIADSFNQIVLTLGFGNVLAGFISSLILVIAHTFNMILGILAVMVHGLRLNVLEFSNHMGLQWAGLKYNPFRRIDKENQV